MNIYFYILIHLLDLLNFNQCKIKICTSSDINYSTFLLMLLVLDCMFLFYSLAINPSYLILSFAIHHVSIKENVILTGFLNSTFTLVSCFSSIYHNEIHLHLNSSHIFASSFQPLLFLYVTM